MPQPLKRSREARPLVHWTLGCILCGANIGGSSLALAASSPASSVYSLSIERAPLDAALQEFARQSGLQLIYFSSITEGVTAPELSGPFTLDAAMSRLLADSGLGYRVVNARTIQVMKSPLEGARKPGSTPRTPPTRAARAGLAADPIEEVQIVAAAEQLVATRISTPLRDIPQSITIVPREQMRQQNQFDLADLLRHVPGVTNQRQTSMQESFFSRAFELTTFHEDGGGALKPGLLSTELFPGAPDLSEFDHVEVLRGSDALFSGNANPSGTVSLVRKRPHPTPALDVTANLGSWNNRRIELDVTGPLAGEGALRGRADAVWSKGDYFFDIAHQERKRLFTVFELDLPSHATLTAGGSYQREDALPVVDGLPFYTTGRDSHLPRNTALTVDWAYYRTRASEVYAQYLQQFTDNWHLKLNGTSERTRIDYGLGLFSGLINPVGGLPRPTAVFASRPASFTLQSADVTLTGVLDLLGKRAEVAIGGDFTRLGWRQYNLTYNDIGPRLLDVAAYDPAAFPDPRGTRPPDGAIDVLETLDQYGGFASVRVELNDAWSTTLGARVASDRYVQTTSVPGLARPFSFSIGYGNSHIVTPLAGVMYRIDDHYSWYVSYADIYLAQAPSVRADGSVVGPAHGGTFETGIKGAWRDGALNGSLAVYRAVQRNKPFLVSTPPGSPPGCCVRTGSIRSSGADLQINGELLPGSLIGAGYTYNASVDADGGFVIASAPMHLLKVWTSNTLPGDLNRWTVGGNVRAQTHAAAAFTLVCSASLQNCMGHKVLQGAFAVVDLRSGFQITPNWAVALSVNNVLDKSYYESFSRLQRVWYGEPRNFMLRVDGKY